MSNIFIQYVDRVQVTSLGSMVEKTTIRTGVGMNRAPTRGMGVSVSVRLIHGTAQTVTQSITSSVSLVVSLFLFYRIQSQNNLTFGPQNLPI